MTDSLALQISLNCFIVQARIYASWPYIIKDCMSYIFSKLQHSPGIVWCFPSTYFFFLPSSYCYFNNDLEIAKHNDVINCILLPTVARNKCNTLPYWPSYQIFCRPEIITCLLVHKYTKLFLWMGIWLLFCYRKTDIPFNTGRSSIN